RALRSFPTRRSSDLPARSAKALGEILRSLRRPQKDKRLPLHRAGPVGWASLLQGLLEAGDFVLQARKAARHSEVIDEKDGPDREIGGHQAIEIFHFASRTLVRPKKHQECVVHPSTSRCLHRLAHAQPASSGAPRVAYGGKSLRPRAAAIGLQAHALDFVAQRLQAIALTQQKRQQPERSGPAQQQHIAHARIERTASAEHRLWMLRAEKPNRERDQGKIK